MIHTVSSTTAVTVDNDNLIEEIEKNINFIIAGSLPYYKSIFKQLWFINSQNANELYHFLLKEQNEKNVKLNTKTTYIKIIFHFNKFLSFKDFDKITRKDITDYLNSLKKSEVSDPTHKWIGTYNMRQMILSKFFRCIHNKNVYEREKWSTPDCLQGIRPLPRKERSPYKPDDIWTNEEHSLFLKYCPEKRDKCYHAMANDTSCRPHELLSLKIGDVKFKISTTGMQYAEIHIKNTKTKPRTLPLIFSIPFIKEWIESHPYANNPNSWLFISLGDRSFGKQLTENALYKLYARNYKQKYFPKLLKDPLIEDRDKAYLRNLLTKPFAPYIQRHSALTHKSQILKESTLRDHAGWSMTSRMSNVYIHYFGNESSKSLLEAYGIESFSRDQNDSLKSKTCPNCNEPNIPEGKFCKNCRMVLTFSAYSETLEEQKKKDDQINQLNEKYEKEMKNLQMAMEDKFNELIQRIDTNKI